MDVVDCTRISRVWARRRVQSRAICPFPEQMSQVASTGHEITAVEAVAIAFALRGIFSPFGTQKATEFLAHDVFHHESGGVTNFGSQILLKGL